ncbi:MAG: NAD(P)-dependent oxidoreductase [Deltaproteobacteria bacterium]|nr:NAD(P)-dependent oxidoreductase [Deltaproteobacteria bacterium]
MVAVSSPSISLQALGKHLQENPATPAMRELRQSLISEGVPLDKLTPTPGIGSHDAYVAATSPEQKLKEYMKFVASTGQYSPSTVPQFLAQAAISYLRAAAAPDGTLTRESVLQKLGSKGAALFDRLSAELNKPQPTTTTTTAFPPNMIGATARSPDRGSLHVAPEVMRRLPIRMMVADLRMVGQLERKLSERSQRRDPARRIAEHLSSGDGVSPFKSGGKPIESPRIAALDQLKLQHQAAQPFAGAKILVLQHLYASTQSILDAAVACGAKAGDITVMGKPYSGSMKVAASMVQKGFQVVVPSLHQSEFSDHEGHMDVLVKEQVARLLAEAGPGDPLLVLDDGGHVCKVVHEHFPEQAHRFRFVEQTQRGATVIKELHARLPGGLKAACVDVAESRAKKEFESPCIGYSVWKETKAIVDKLGAQGVTLPRQATVLGFGAVGSQVARELKEAGYSVHVFDPDPKRQADAAAGGFTVHAEKTSALAKANLLVSATGRTAVSLDDVKFLPKECVLVNAASANNELNATNLLVLQMMSANALMGTVRIGPKGVEIPRSLISQVDTATLDEKGHLWDSFQGKPVDLGRDDSATQRDRVIHTKEGQHLYTAHAGFVVNLTDDDDPIPPRYIGLTRSLLFAALVQTAKETRTGLVDLDDGVQQQVIDATQADLKKTGESLLDPRF